MARIKKTPEEKKAAKKAWYEKNKEVTIQRAIEWRKQNPEKYKAMHAISQKKSDEKNIEKVKARRREYSKKRYIPRARKKMSKEEKLQKQRNYQRNHYQKNKNKIIEKLRVKRYLANKDKIDARNKKLEEKVEYRKRMDAIHALRSTEEGRKQSDKETREKWLKAHPDYQKNYHKKRKEMLKSGEKGLIGPGSNDYGRKVREENHKRFTDLQAMMPSNEYNNILALLKPLVMNSIDGTPSAKQDYWDEYKVAHNITEY